jgi:hypothetical protein
MMTVFMQSLHSWLQSAHLPVLTQGINRRRHLMDSLYTFVHIPDNLVGADDRDYIFWPKK